jgi:pimeloyl-ACP methyl ester carboxylesterase
VVHAGTAPYLELSPEARDDPEGQAVALLQSGDIDGATRLLTEAADRELGELRGLDDAEFDAAMRQLAPSGETWLDRHPPALAAFETDFRRAIGGSDGYVRDNLSWCGPWDLDLTAVAAHARLVYGDADQMVPQTPGEWLRQRLPDCELHVVPGGHGDATLGAAADTFAALA